MLKIKLSTDPVEATTVASVKGGIPGFKRSVVALFEWLTVFNLINAFI